MNFWLILAAVEAGVVIFVLLAASWVGQALARRRDRQAVRTLVDRVTAQKAQRAEAIRGFLRRNFDPGDEQLETRSVAILREELRLYQRFANLYLRRDAGSVANFQIPLEACVEPYWQLKSEGRAAPAASTGDVELLDAGEDPELERLRAEVEGLRRRTDLLGGQLSLAVDNLARMLDEYSSLFDGQTVEDLSGPPLMAEAREILAENGAPAGDKALANPEPSLAPDSAGVVPAGGIESAPGNGEAEAEAGAGVEQPDSSAALRGGAIEEESESLPDTTPEGASDGQTDPLQSRDPGDESEILADPQSEMPAPFEPGAGPVAETIAGETLPMGAEADPLESTVESTEESGRKARDDIEWAPPPAAVAEEGAQPASGAADELMASLDANLPEAPEEPQPAPVVPVTDAEIDALFDAEPAPGLPDSGAARANSDKSLGADERDDEPVAIVEKAQKENALS